MRTVDEHLSTVLEHVRALDPLDVALLDSRGCLLAEPVRAVEALPPFDSSAVEGYAVRCVDLLTAAAETPVTLTVIDDVPPGYRASRPVGAGTAIRIGAGALMPEGADAVVAVQDTDSGRREVAVVRPPVLGQGIRRAGAELRAGGQALAAGTLVGAREVAVLAAIGRSRVLVRPKPRVVVMSTGTELVEPDRPLTPGLLHDAAGYLLTAAAEDAGAMAYRAGPIPDERPALTEALEDQLVRADLIVTTGGISAMTYDTMKGVLDELGEVEFSRVAMSPATGQGHGWLGPDRVPIFTLPGSPAAAFVAFEVFVRPVIRRLLGHDSILRHVLGARLGQPVAGEPGLRTYLPARTEGPPDGPVVRPLPGSGLPALQRADCLIMLPEDSPPLAAGTRVAVMPLDGAS